MILSVEDLIDHILDHRTEVPVLILVTIFIFPEEPLEIIKEHAVKHRVLRRQESLGDLWTMRSHMKIILSHSYFRDLTGSAVAALITCQLIAREDTRRVSKAGIRKTIGPSFV